MAEVPDSPGGRIFLAAGEASGDRLGGDLAAALAECEPTLELAGISGPRMRKLGVEPWARTEDLSVMGLAEVLRRLPALHRLRGDLKKRIQAWQPRAFVGIDSPDFNLGLARWLKARRIPAVHYVSPSVWAWRAYRIGKIARSLDLLLTLFPFEPEVYEGTGLDVRFVGHPLADAIPRQVDCEPARSELGLATDRPVITLLPGSRPGELQRHARLVAETALRLRQRVPEVQLVMALADPSHEAVIRHQAASALDRAQIRILSGRTHESIAAASAVLAASGTVTLECLLLKRPMVVFYRLAPTTYHLVRGLRLVRSRWISLPNVLAGGALVPERIQNMATPAILSTDLLDLLGDETARAEFVDKAGAIHEQLARGASRCAAEAILEKTRTP